MRTHLTLVYEQLDTLIALLVEEARLLVDGNAGAGTWPQEDLETLAQAVGTLETRVKDAQRCVMNGADPGSVRHTLCVPLASVLGLSELLINTAEDALDSDRCRLLQHIHIAAGDLAEIIDEILRR